MFHLSTPSSLSVMDATAPAMSRRIVNLNWETASPAPPIFFEVIKASVCGWAKKAGKGGTAKYAKYAKAGDQVN